MGRTGLVALMMLFASILALAPVTPTRTLFTGATMAAEQDPLPDFDSRWDYDHPDATETVFRGILPAAKASGDRDYLAQLLTQIARSEGLQMKFDEAARTLDEVEALITPGMKVARVRLLLERGRMLNSSKRRDESRPLFQAAWDLAREAGADGYAVDAAHMLGIVERGEASVEWNLRAIAYAEASANPAARRWLGSLYNNLGWTRHAAGEYEAALDLFRKALGEREGEGKPDRIRTARWCVARALRSLGRIEEALEMQRQLLAEFEKAGEQDGYVHEEIGECLLALGRAGEAAPRFAEAWRLLSKDPWLQRDEPERLERMRRLGGLEGSGG